MEIRFEEMKRMMPPLMLPPRPPPPKRNRRGGFHRRRNAVHYNVPSKLNIITVDNKVMPVILAKDLFTIPENHTCDSDGLELLSTVATEMGCFLDVLSPDEKRLERNGNRVLSRRHSVIFK